MLNPLLQQQIQKGLSKFRQSVSQVRISKNTPTIGQAAQQAWDSNLFSNMTKTNTPIKPFNNLAQKAGFAGEGLLENLSFGTVNIPNRAPVSRGEQSAKMAGGLAGLFAPVGVASKVLAPVGRTTETLAGLKLGKLGLTGKKLNVGRVLAGEAAQTGVVGGIRAATGQQFDPMQDLGYGLGARGILGTAGKFLRPLSQARRVDKLNSYDRMLPEDLKLMGDVLERLHFKSDLDYYTTGRIQDMRALKGMFEMYGSEKMLSKMKDDDLIKWGTERFFEDRQVGGIPGAMGFAGKNDINTNNIDINKYLKNAYKVYTNQKPHALVARISEDLAANTKLPRDIVVRQAFFEKMAQSHPDIDKTKLFQFVKTLNIPDEIYQTSKENRLNFFKTLENDVTNLVSTGKDYNNIEQNVISYFKPFKKYEKQIKNTSKKVFPIDSGRTGNPSSDMLSQVPGIGALSRSSESSKNVANKAKIVKSQKMFSDFIRGKINDVMPRKHWVEDSLSSQGIVRKGKLKAVNIPTQTEIKNRAEINIGNLDLYDQRLNKWSKSEPYPWETKAQGTTQAGQPLPNQGKLVTGESRKAQSSPNVSPKETYDEIISQQNKKIEIPTDTASQRKAETSTLIGNRGKGGIEGFDTDTRNAFQGWVNSRHATQVEGYLKNKEFSDLDKEGIEGFFKIQAGDTSGKLSKVREYFDNKFKTLKDTGYKFNYQQDYLPQQWDNSNDEIMQVFGRSLGTKPSFTLDKIIEDYKTGIQAGLKPKFKTIGQLVGWYEEKANKAIADKKFFDYLGTQGMIQPSSKAPRDWITIDPDKFPKIKVSTDDVDYVGTYKAPQELADAVNNYLKDPQAKWLERTANYVSRVKNIALNFGIPTTAINMHGINTLARHTLFGSGSNPLNRFLTAGQYMVRPQSAQNYLDKELVKAPEAIKNGLTLGAEDYTGVGKQAENLAGQFSKKWEDVFGTPLFNKMIPAIKLSSYQELVKNKMDPKEAAKLVNNVYGGINWEQMGRNRDYQNLLRSIILAPDWGETTVRLGGNFAKALNPLHKSPVANRYRTMMATFVGSYVALNVANKLTSGHYAYENDPGHVFELEAGYTTDGEKRYVRPYGTAMDMFRIPHDVIKGLKNGDVFVLARTLRNRLSIPAGAGVGVITDTDYRGNAIGYKGVDKYGNPIDPRTRAVNIGTEMASLVGFPSFLKQFSSSATGQQGWEQGLTQGFELPFRYSNTGNSAIQKQTNFIAQEQGLKGKDLYDFNQGLKGQNKLGDKQLENVKSGVLTLNDIMDKRASDKKKDEIIESLKTSDQTSVEHNGVYYLKQDNNYVKVIDHTKPIEPVKLTGQEDLDKKLISSYKNKVSTRQSEVAKLYEAGKITAEEAEKEIDRLEKMKTSTGKGKKPKKLSIKISKIKAPTAKLKTGGGSKKLPKLKDIKVKTKKGKLVFKKPKKLNLKALQA